MLSVVVTAAIPNALAARPRTAPERGALVIGTREETAILTAFGVAVIGADLLWWHQTWLLIAGLVVTAVLATSLIAELRKGRDWRHQEMTIRHLWQTAKRMPTGQTFRDPATGVGITALRDRGTVALTVVDPPPTDQTALIEQIKTTYVLGSGYAPDPPPLLHHITPAAKAIPVRRRFRQTTAMLHFNHQTGGALQTGIHDLAELNALVDRALATRR